MMADLGIAEIRAEGRRLLAAAGRGGHSELTDLEVFMVDNAVVLLADPGPVGLTEDERATVMRIGEKHNWPGGYMQHDFAALLAIIDRLVPVSPSVDPEEKS